MIRKVKASFDRKLLRSFRKIARELNILRERMQYVLKNEFELKPFKFQKGQKFTDGQKKLDWKETRSYFACKKLAI